MRYSHCIILAVQLELLLELSVVKEKYARFHSENELKESLACKGYSCFSWHDGPGAYYSPLKHVHDEFIFVLSGSIVFDIYGQKYCLTPGYMLVLPSNTVHLASKFGSCPVGSFICTRNS